MSWVSVVGGGWGGQVSKVQGRGGAPVSRQQQPCLCGAYQSPNTCLDLHCVRGAERDTQAAHQWLSALRGEPDSSFSERHQVSFGGRWPDMDDDDDDDGRKAAFWEPVFSAWRVCSMCFPKLSWTGLIIRGTRVQEADLNVCLLLFPPSTPRLLLMR